VALSVKKTLDNRTRREEEEEEEVLCDNK
jgi:hypothetical protein